MPLPRLLASKDFLSIPSFAKNTSGQAFWLKFMSSLFFHGFIHSSSIVWEPALSGRRGQAQSPAPAGSHSPTACDPLFSMLVSRRRGGGEELAQGCSTRGCLEDLLQEAGARAGFSAKVPSEDRLAGEKAS